MERVGNGWVREREKRSMAEASREDGRGQLKERLRRSNQALWASVALNGILFGACVYWGAGEREAGVPLELGLAKVCSLLPPLKEPHNPEAVLAQFRQLPYEQLLHRLSDMQCVQGKVRRCDLALSCLVQERHLDVRRALEGHLLQPQEVKVCDGEVVTLYCGLCESHFRQVLRFAQRESWPFTHKGLYAMIQSGDFEELPTLRRAFYAIPQFRALERLLRKGGQEVRRVEMLHMVVEAPWELLQEFWEEQLSVGDLSDQRRQEVLLRWVKEGSPYATQLLLTTDFSHAVKELDDEDCVRVLELLPENFLPAHSYALSVLIGPRSEATRFAAARKLYQIADESEPEQLHLAMALRHFAPELSWSQTAEGGRDSLRAFPSFKKRHQAPLSTRVHHVGEGETLGEIATRYLSEPQDLLEANQMEKEEVREGDWVWVPGSPLYP